MTLSPLERVGKKTNGELPLFSAVGNDGTDLETVKLLLSRFPEALSAVDRQENTALNAAAAAGAKEAVVLFLLKAAPEAAKRQNDSGRLPIHSYLAASRND